MRRAPAIAAALPAVALVLVSMALLVSAAAGRHPRLTRLPMNMSEAAAMRDGATIIRLIDEGEDPHAARPIAAGMLFGRPVTLTPLEAAIAARRAEVVDILLWRTNGADAQTVARARCLAQRDGDADISRVLERYASGGPEPECSGITLPW